MTPGPRGALSDTTGVRSNGSTHSLDSHVFQRTPPLHVGPNAPVIDRE